MRLNNIKSKKSQITVFMIIGIVILIIFGLVFYVISYAAKKESGGETELTEEQLQEIKPIQNYVTFCLDKVSADALQLLGKQGGVIFKSQGGTIKEYDASELGKFYLKDGSYIVPYAIMPLSISILSLSAELPAYPWQDYPNNPPLFRVYGEDRFPPLYKSQGSHSLQRQLESYVNDHIRNCTDFSVFQPQGFSVIAEAPNTSTIIGKKDVSVNLVFPLEITKTAAGQKVKISKFNSNQKVRLKTIYDFVKNIINKDVTDIGFDPRTLSSSEMQVIVTAEYYNKDDLINIMDTQSKIWNEPYIMRFARKNRMPALQKISNPAGSFNAGDLITNTSNEIKINDVLLFKPVADDPDEDAVDFVYNKNNLHATLTFPYNITNDDKINGLKIIVNATDGELSDYQEVKTPIS
ncbi:hypothetical protein HYU07_00220 [Candidatus Woesearchaeota archaeon]|nr:hypothetical protein [Candidatus Woesearchaeota archaeon]